MKRIRLVASSAALVAASSLFAAELPKLEWELKSQILAQTTDFGAGADRSGSRTDLHLQRLRLEVAGMLNDVWGFRFQTDNSTGTTKQSAVGHGIAAQDTDANDRDIRLMDAFAFANFNEALNLQFGLTKIPLTRANLDDCFGALSFDRSMFVQGAYGSSPTKFSRDLGVVSSGTFQNDKLRYWVGAFQGREGMTRTTHPFSGASVSSSIEPSNNLEYIARVHYSLIGTETANGYKGTYFGTQHILTVGASVAYEADAVYKNVGSTGALLDNATVDYTVMSADLFYEVPFEGGAFTLVGQYLKVDFDDGYKTNLNAGDRMMNLGGSNGQKNGWLVKSAYLLPLKIGKEGRLQPFAFYEDWKFAFLLGNTDQKIQQTGLGLNYYIKENRLRISAEYLKTEFEKPTGFYGSRVDASNAPIDKMKENTAFRLMLQIMI